MKTITELFNDAGTKISEINSFGVIALKTANANTAAAIYQMLTAASDAGKAVQAVANVVSPRVAKSADLPPMRPVSTDASNAPPGFPTHSPEGFALFYPIGGNGQPTGAPEPLYGGRTHASINDLQEYVLRSTERAANLDQWQRDENINLNYTGTINPDTLTRADHAYLASRPDLWPRAGQIFTKKPTPRDTATGRLYTPGDLANTNISNYNGVLLDQNV